MLGLDELSEEDRLIIINVHVLYLVGSVYVLYLVDDELDKTKY